MTELQERTLAMLAWFHDSCETHNLKYYVIGGTMLGAARHKGFIPWDDDIDVGMPREDYDKFSSLFGDMLSDRYYVETIYTEKNDFYYGYTKIYDIHTTLVENTRYKIKRGIFIDIFPIDNTGNSIEESKEMYDKIHKKYNFLLIRTLAIRRKRKFIKNIPVMIGRMIPSFIINNKKLMLKIDDLCKVKKGKDCKYVCNFYGAYGIKEIIPLEYFGVPQKYEFENLSVYGPEKFDEYLKLIYGKWELLPPIEKQISHHDFLSIDLNEPF